MNTEALFLFLILLLGLVLCSFLGGDYYKEGFAGKIIGTIDIDDDILDANIVSGASTGTSTNYDNYNHYTGGATRLLSGSTYYGPNGSTAIVSSETDGSQILKILLPGTNVPIVLKQISKLETAHKIKEGLTNMTENIGEFKNEQLNTTATVSNKSQGEQLIEVKTPTGSYTYSSVIEQKTPEITSTQYYGATGSQILKSPDSYSGIPKSQIPAGKEDLYVLKTSVVPTVCPTCPTCPQQQTTIPRQEPCPPCPACARCPEQPFECKKVATVADNAGTVGTVGTSYNAGTVGTSYAGMAGYTNNNFISSLAGNNEPKSLPVPVLSDFSTFGM